MEFQKHIMHTRHTSWQINLNLKGVTDLSCC